MSKNQIKTYGKKIIELYEALETMYNNDEEKEGSLGKNFETLITNFENNNYEACIEILQKIEYSKIKNNNSKNDKIKEWGLISNKLKDIFIEEIYEKIETNGKKFKRKRNFFEISRKVYTYVEKNQNDNNGFLKFRAMELEKELLETKICCENEKTKREQIENEFHEILNELQDLKKSSENFQLNFSTI